MYTQSRVACTARRIYLVRLLGRTIAQALVRRTYSTAATRHASRVPLPTASADEFDGIDGLGCMLELDGEQGFLLWRTLRNVRLWAATPRDGRAGLFVEGAYEQRLAEILSLDLAGEEQQAFTLLAQLLENRLLDPRVVSTSCVTLARWAESHSMHIAALELLHAAALASPNDAYFALQAGRKARDQAKHALAEEWLQRAIVVGREGGDWENYARAHVACGIMMTTRGSFPAARRHLRRAASRAERHHLREVQAMAHHDLFVVESECGNHPLATQHARRALHAYPSGHPDRAGLAFDVAYNWLLQGYFAVALPLLRQVAPRVAPQIRANVQGAVARAAGAEGRRDEYLAAREALIGLQSEARHGAIWANVAYGAISLKRWPEAEEAAELALRLGRTRGEHKTVLIAEGLLEQVRSRTSQPSEPDTSVVELEAITTLAHELTLSLAAC